MPVTTAMACVVLLASQVAALMESKPPVTLPKNGQLDPFSYSMYLDDTTEDSHRLHLPHLRAPAGLHLPHLRGPSADRLQKVAKAAPVVALVLNEIPAVREQLSDWLGRDVPAASGVASNVIRFGVSEARRLGDNVLETVRQPVQAVSRKVGAVAKELEKDLDETVPVLAEHKAEELIHHKPKAPRRFSPWLVGTLWFDFDGCPRLRSCLALNHALQIPAAIPSRESVLQRAPSQSALTPVKVHKVEFQRVGLGDGAEWDSPDEQEQEAEPPQARHAQDMRRMPSFSKMNSNTEYYQIGGHQDSQSPSPRKLQSDRVLGA
ncbi:rlmJ [Symbiodinium natans]|uniref:RlmJ protein n=1 Tax=Symbiodinium natans TaxID=878477 RepID=A0A812QEP0_9DINO|nr:rlmJ [Symbiodinium natans]